jgi:asparagine synthetase B (glutamine-hydrolysing)
MCGILYSQNKDKFTDLTMLKQRGPDGFYELKHNYGYFAQSLLNTIGEKTLQPFFTNDGIFLYNGSTYNSGEVNDTKWIGQHLDDNLDNTIEVIKSLDGEFALIYVTSRHIVFCTDHFSQRNLWFYYNEVEKQISICTIPNIIHQKHNGAWQTDDNKIYIIDKHSFKLKIITNKNWNLQQKTNHLDYVMEKFEESIIKRYNPNTSTNLISSGFDSGVINCATYKLFKNTDCVADPAGEIKKVIKDRMKVHNVKLVINDGHDNEPKTMFNEIFQNDHIWANPSVLSLTNIIKKYVKKKKKRIIIFGTGGDEIYNDWHQQRHGFIKGKTNGLFPTSLCIAWPWYNYHGRLRNNVSRYDFICGFFGIEARNPLLDIKLVQTWLNTSVDVKNLGYKEWMKRYMDQKNYPYSMEKVHWAHEKYNPEQWKMK